MALGSSQYTPLLLVGAAVWTARHDCAGLFWLPSEHLPAVQVPVPPQIVPSGAAVVAQPSLLSHESVVHGSASSQTMALPAQLPAVQVSAFVQAEPSSQVPGIANVWQPLLGSHQSTVQVLPSSHTAGLTPLHAPPLHTSPLVQALPSLHGAAFAVAVQPLDRSHASSVQALPSSHIITFPGRQLPPAHASPLVHAEPSSQGCVVALCWQPLAGAHWSAVQPLLSSQSTGTPPEQLAFTHISPLVHALPSSQLAVLAVWLQPALASHASSVQMLPSSHTIPFPGKHLPT